ncbi:hypothetical protein C7N43_33110 [Sphingobacteriales bacterium UPWRP_1]|nr:hypothetical protein B6N25_08540 [Sphingobacteriales bacterium TSM_CSS]PSJ72655.1 hypothetical protein C7N43_33110 [Sphingobacteriales bacterium UPWRP_1]
MPASLATGKEPTTRYWCKKNIQKTPFELFFQHFAFFFAKMRIYFLVLFVYFAAISLIFKYKFYLNQYIKPQPYGKSLPKSTKLFHITDCGSHFPSIILFI